jgi:hypothetical protein
VPRDVALVSLWVMLAASATSRASCGLSLISALVKALTSSLPWSFSSDEEQSIIWLTKGKANGAEALLVCPKRIGRPSDKAWKGMMIVAAAVFS